MENMFDRNNAVIDADVTPPARMNIADALTALKTTYKNVAESIQSGTYTKTNLAADVETLDAIATEMQLIYDLDMATLDKLESILAKADLTVEKLDENILNLSRAAARMDGYILEIDEIHTSLTETKTEGIQVTFHPFEFVKSLNYMWQGMLIIMLVMCVLISGTALLNKASHAIAEAKNGNKNGTKDDN